MHFVFGYRAAEHTSIKSASSPETIPSVPVDLINALNKYHNPKKPKNLSSQISKKLKIWS
jgi:hypothetical protein